MSFSPRYSPFCTSNLQRYLPRVGKPVMAVLWYKNAFSLVNEDLLIIHSYQCGTLNDDPVFAPVVVVLKAQSLSRFYGYLLYLVLVPIGEQNIFPLVFSGCFVMQSTCKLDP